MSHRGDCKNSSFQKLFDKFLDKYELRSEVLDSSRLVVKTFNALQILYSRERNQFIPLFRGKELISMGDISYQTTKEMADDMANWLFRNLELSGRMPYKYWPSRGREAESNNMIRQFMATIALGRWAYSFGTSKEMENHKSNLKF